MALIKFGGGITEMRGSIAGNTFARNRYGAYVRARTKPINPDTTLQQAVRASVSALSTRWADTLTAAQRTAWNLYAASVNMKNKLGETIHLSGFNHYIRSNAFLSRYSITNIDAGPVDFTLPAQDPTLTVTASEATQQFMIAFDDTHGWESEDNAYMTFLFGQPQNPQRNFFAGPWKGVRYLSGSVGVPLVSPLPVGALFYVSEGQRAWVQMRIHRADGRLSEQWTANCIVLAAFP